MSPAPFDSGSGDDASPAGGDSATRSEGEARLEAQLLITAGELGASFHRERLRAAALAEALEELRHAYLETVRSLAYVVEAKDAYTGQHLERCRVYGMALLREMGLLDEPGPLTAGEWRVMRTHPLIGYQMIGGIPFLRSAAEVVRYHHETFDGTGYPEGLRGEEIPLAARIFAVADAFDAMTTDRPYRAALSLDVAVDQFEKMAGTQFDPEVVRVFVPMCERLLPSGR